MNDDTARIITLLEEIRDELRELNKRKKGVARAPEPSAAQAGRRIGSAPSELGYASIDDDGSWDSGSIDDLLGE